MIVYACTPKPSPSGEGAPVRTLGRMRGYRAEYFHCRKKELNVGNFLFIATSVKISTFPLIRHGFAVPPSPEGNVINLSTCKKG